MDDNRLLPRLLAINYFCLRTHIDASAPGFIGLNDASLAVNDCRCRKVGARYMLHQAIDINLRVLH